MTYRRSVAALKLTSGYTDTLREYIADILSGMDEACRLNAKENWQLACKFIPEVLILRDVGVPIEMARGRVYSERSVPY